MYTMTNTERVSLVTNILLVEHCRTTGRRASRAQVDRMVRKANRVVSVS